MNFCSNCANSLNGQTYPIKCGQCGAEYYQNPLAVSVAMIPVGDSFLLIRRNIEPGLGMLAFPGGFVDLGETSSQGAVREVKEEVGIDVSGHSTQFVNEINVARGKHNLIFIKFSPLDSKELENFTPNSETQEVILINKSNLKDLESQMAFPSHLNELKKVLGVSNAK